MYFVSFCFCREHGTNIVYISSGNLRVNMEVEYCSVVYLFIYILSIIYRVLKCCIPICLYIISSVYNQQGMEFRYQRTKPIMLIGGRATRGKRDLKRGVYFCKKGS